MTEQRIPFVKVQLDDDDIAAVEGVLRSGWLTTASQVKALEEELCAYTGARFVNAVNSATAAMHLCLAAWDLGPGDEVITTPYTFTATANVVLHCGATPVLVDVVDGTANIDPRLVEAAITPKTKAIIPVHIAGEPCDMDALMAMARPRGIKVLEDAAHAIGTLYRGRAIGTVSDAAAFSFYANKTMTTGEGGALATNDAELSGRVRRLTLHGMSRDAYNRYGAGGSWRYDIEEFGFKDNLTDIAAALGRAQLVKLERFIEERTRVAQRYFANLRDEEHILLPVFSEENRQPWHLFMIRIKNETSPVQRDDVINQLAERGIATSVHFIPLHYHTAYQKLGRWAKGDFPVAERFFEGEISLPMYPAMTNEEVDEVCQALREILHP
ncbi:MAG TPA: DegT/DnrJ/EryC1/StrS aminotransferase family protein [Tepidiformaceae bacterium]|nr:DegT/DnrJ/EryC1/StrS aminotransferase family protein [Tepidiformaceae bacterium]